MENIDIIRSALLSRGFECEDMTLDSRSFSRFSEDGAVRWLTYHTPALAYPTTHNAIREISRNKTIATSYVNQLGYRTPKSITVSVEDGIDNALGILSNAPLIVKPESGSLSRGLKRNIVAETELRDCVKKCLSDGDTCVIQEQVAGEEIRFVAIGKKLVAAVMRKRPYVIGNGVSTVRDLIKAENRDRRNINNTMVPYPELTSDMLDMPFDNDSIPTLDEEVVLGFGTMIMNGASMYNVIDEIHPGYCEMIEHISKSLGADFIAVDVIVDDYKRFDNYWFIEFNTSPVLRLFYSCRDGKHFDAGAVLAEMIDRATMPR